jgi:hypothetical protein
VLVPLTDHVAVVSLTSDVPTRSLMQAAAAVQKQITRDFTPYWGLRATVDAFEDLESVPSDYRVVVVFGNADELTERLTFALGEQQALQLIDVLERDRLAGLHLNAFTREPFALVSSEGVWSVTLSHEVIEMITDPFGNRLIAAAHPRDKRQRVKYLLEVCDPCQTMWYPVNGVPVSDFFTPRYFDPVEVDSSRFSFTGALTRPLHILSGGFLCWIDPEDSGLYQLGADEDEPRLLADLDQLRRSTAPLRTIVDSRTPPVMQEMLRPAISAPAARSAYDAVREASEGAALRTREALLSLATEAT